MKVSDALNKRISTRAFLDKSVPRDLVEDILRVSRQAPSGGNLQPWHVYVVMGDKRDELVKLIQDKAAESPGGEGTEYNIYPPELKDPYRARRFQCGEDMYATIGIPRDQKLERLMQVAKNFEFFGAPVGLFFSIDRQMQEGQWSDLGMFIQSFMLLAVEHGLATCAQEAWAIWHKTVAEFVGIPDEQMLFCGMSLGYPDEAAPINGLRTARAELDEFVKFLI